MLQQQQPSMKQQQQQQQQSLEHAYKPRQFQWRSIHSLCVVCSELKILASINFVKFCKKCLFFVLAGPDSISWLWNKWCSPVGRYTGMIDKADISFVVGFRRCNCLIDHTGPPAVIIVLNGLLAQTDNAGSSRAVNSGGCLRYCWRETGLQIW